MQRLLTGVGLGVVLTLAVGGGYVAWQAAAETPAEQMCGHLMEVCEPDGDVAEALAECTASMDEWTAEASEEEVSRLTTCVVDADGCAEASGCLVGHGLRQAFDGVGDFFQGMGKAMGFGK